MTVLLIACRSATCHPTISRAVAQVVVLPDGAVVPGF